MRHPDKILILNDQGNWKRLHLFGDYVAVVVQCYRKVTNEEKPEDWKRSIVEIIPKTGRDNRYIDFVAIREADKGPYIDEDSPVRGGLDAEFAQGIAVDLAAAAEYLLAVENGAVKL